MADVYSTESYVRAANRLSSFAEELHGAMVCCGGRIRVEILGHLACGPMGVHDLAVALSLDDKLVSRYLIVLARAGWVQMVPDGREHLYALAAGVQVRRMDHLIEIRLPTRSGLWTPLILPRALLLELHPDARPPIGPVAQPSAASSHGTIASSIPGREVPAMDGAAPVPPTAIIPRPASAPARPPRDR